MQTADGQWTAEWNESLIAKTEDSVSSVRGGAMRATVVVTHTYIYPTRSH